MESTFLSSPNLDVNDTSRSGSRKATISTSPTLAHLSANMAAKTASKSSFLPMPELTPDASPRSGSPDTLESSSLRPLRRYAPQPLDTMRRGRRDGDLGLPRLTDRADDTPYARPKQSGTKTKRRPAGGNSAYRRPPPLAADDHEHESEDDFLLELAARRAERQLHEAALAAFPSSRARDGAANHFYSRESDSETTASESRFSAQPSYTRRRVRGRGAGLRRRSTDLGWWHKVMQEHAEQKVRAWQVQHHEPIDSEVLDVRDVESEPESIDWYREKVHIEDSPVATAVAPKDELQSAPASVPAPTEDKPHADVQIVAPKPRKLHKEQGEIARAICAEPQEDESVDMEFEIMRRAASPPLLGDNIVFPRCHSPEPCRLSTDLPYTLRAFEEGRRDLTQKSGLWGGYCYNSAEEQQRAAVEGAMSITCASVLESQPHALALESVTDSCSYLSIVQRERRAAEPEQRAVLSPPATPVTAGLWGNCATRASSRASSRAPTMSQTRGLSPFQSLGSASICRSPSPVTSVDWSRVGRRMSVEEKERRIATEFDDHFITQVYNYLSLSYPASARAFDEELSGTTGLGLGLDDMRRDDAAILAKGLIWDDEVEKLPEPGRCARWRALKAYVHNWARAQDDLDELSPGVRGRPRPEGSLMG